MEKRRTFSSEELDKIEKRTSEIASDPWMLFTAYAISELQDLLREDFDCDDEDCPKQESVWGMEIPDPKHFKSFARQVAEDFIDCAENYKPVTAFGKRYSIKNARGIDWRRAGLESVYGFVWSDGRLIADRDLIIDLSDRPASSYEQAKTEAAENRAYLHRVCRLAEDDDANGWDQLNDMEVAMYCWAKYSLSGKPESIPGFWSEYRDYLYVSKEDFIGCLIDNAKNGKKISGAHTFSFRKALRWANLHNQPMRTQAVPQDEADDYWYNVFIQQK